MTLLFTMPFMVSCGPAFFKKMLKDNPEIITESIKSNPQMYMEALAEAQRQYMMERRKKQQKEEMASREEEFKNPKKPEMKDSRVYFGNKSAPITIVEYSDFQCGYCAKAVPTMKKILKNYPDKVRVLYKHKPLFPGSDKAAYYYEAVGMQSSKKAREFHDMVFAQKEKIRQGDSFFKSLATKLSVDMDKLAEDLDKVKSIVDADAKEAEKFGFSGTPGFLVGGVSVPGAVPYSHFKEIIDRHLSSMKHSGSDSAKEEKATATDAEPESPPEPEAEKATEGNEEAKKEESAEGNEEAKKEESAEN